MNESLRQTYASAMFGEDSRGRLLRATAIVVGRKGVHNCTVQDILDEADLSRRTFYKTFSNMEEALDALFEVATGLLQSQIEEAVAGSTSPVETVRNAVDAYLNLQLVGGRLIVVLQDESRRPDSLLAPRREELIDRFSLLLQRTMEAATENNFDPMIYRSFVLMLEGLVHDVQKEGRLNREKVERIRDVTLSSFFKAVGVGDSEEYPTPLKPTEE